MIATPLRSLFVAFLVLVHTNTASAQEAPLPEGIRHVPHDAWLFAHWRVGELLKTPIGKGLWQAITADKQFAQKVTLLEEKTGVSINDVESVTLLVLEPPMPRGPGAKKFFPDMNRGGDFLPPRSKDVPQAQPLKQAPRPKADFDRKPADGLEPIALQQPWEMHDHDFDHGPRPEPLIIVTSSKPLDRKKLLQAAQDPDQPERLEVSFMFLSDRSLLISSARSLVRYADLAAAGRAGQPKGDSSLIEALELARPGAMPKPKGAGVIVLKNPGTLLAVAGIRSSPALKQLLLRDGMDLDHERNPILAAVYPLLNTSSAGLTVHFAKELTYTLHLHSRTERGLTLAVESAKTVLALGELLLDRMLASKDKDLEEAATYLRALRDAVAGATVDASAVGPEGARAQLRMHLKADEKILHVGIAAMLNNLRATAGRAQSINNLKQIALALHSYHDVYKGLPPPAWSPKQGVKPQLSWRVAILPFIEHQGLYQQFKHDEPWDSPHNMKLIEQMPPIYEVPGVKKGKPGTTHYQVFTGPGAMFEHKPNATLTNITLVHITDGTSNTLMVVEAKEPVIWTKPDDLVFDPKGPLPKLGVFPNGFHAAWGDGAVRFIPARLPEATLRAMITRDGGEVVPFDF